MMKDQKPRQLVRMAKGKSNLVQRQCLRCDVSFIADGRFQRLCSRHRNRRFGESVSPNSTWHDGNVGHFSVGVTDAN